MIKEEIIVKKGKFFDEKKQKEVDLGPYIITIKEIYPGKEFVHKPIGSVYSKIVGEHSVLIYSNQKNSESSVFGVKDSTCTKRDLSNLLRKKAREIGEQHTKSSIKNAFIKHAKNLENS